MLLCQSVLILVPSILSWPWNPHRSWWGRGGMDIIHCSWSWCVYYIKRPLPLFCVFPSLSLNRIEIKHASVFVKIIFPLHWRFYSVSIWVTRHFGQVILVMPASTLYPPTQHTHTHSPTKMAVVVLLWTCFWGDSIWGTKAIWEIGRGMMPLAWWKYLLLGQNFTPGHTGQNLVPV